MSFWEWLGIAGVFASVFGAWIGWAARYNGRMTREFIKEEHHATRDLIHELHELVREIHQSIEKMDERMEAMDKRHTELFGEILKRK